MERPPRIPSETVERFVRSAHGDLEDVRLLLEQEPGLVNAVWDWGGGDWESGLGAAAHTGRRDIAELLLSKGARLDVFAAAMLGRLAVVRAIVEAVPAMRTAAGPHGIPLIVHAKMGGEAARPVLEYLEGR